MIASNISNTETVRNVFIIDDKGIVRTILIYPMTVGRYIPEILRILEALQTGDCNKAATPANWGPGMPIINPSPKTFEGLEKRAEEIKEKNNGMGWYLSFENPDLNCKNKSE